MGEQLKLREVDYYLPLYTAVHRWKARRAQVELPLFPGYIFVHLPVAERLRVLEIPGVAYLVGSSGGPLPLPDSDIESIRSTLTSSISRQAEPHPYLGPGSRVRIAAGPLSGLEGTIIRQKGYTRFIISVDLIMRSIAVNVEAADLNGVERPEAIMAAA